MLKKTFQIISISSIFYVLTRRIIALLIGGNTQHFIYYNVTNDITWYLLEYIIPISIGLLIAFILKNKTSLFNFSRVFLPFLLLLNVVGGIINFKYWGYFSKRPTVFSELKNANEILAINQTNKFYNDTILFSANELNPEYYYFIIERPFVAMLENGHSRGNLLDYETIFKSKKTKISEKEIQNSKAQIKASKFIDQPEKSYEDYTDGVNVLFVEFTTSKENNVSVLSLEEMDRKPSLKYNDIYTYVLLDSDEISNDHYGVYEFLFKDNKLIKKQKFYYDNAGWEYWEYPPSASYFESILLGIIFLLYIFFQFVVKKLWAKYRQ